ncbi:MAG: M15 family metallopeptidase [Ilumatobacteraceae bacterium]
MISRSPSPRTRTSLAAVAVAWVVSSVVAIPGIAQATDEDTVPPPPVIDHTDDTPWGTPTRPPSCTAAQIEMGDVRACLLTTFGSPAERGWGTPPTPGVGDGWVWTGSNYDGSPALAEWEATTLTTSSEPLGRIRAGELETHIGAAALFEGFLAEIDHHGYEILEGKAYGFRCTAGTGGWDCPRQTLADLSFHAWGLAVDFNAGANPIVTVRGSDGVSACATPMETDIPRWVVQTAEKWGLYWGGYGFSRDCTSPEQMLERTFRDPPHFEFRGTPELAERIARFNLRNDPTLGCYDVVGTDGAERMRCNREFTVEAGWRVAVDPGAPEGATAAIVNLTATGADDAGFLTLESCTARPAGMPETSNVNYASGADVANLATVALDPDGRFCVYHDTEVHAIVDVIGFIGSASDEFEPGWFAPADPTRVHDTRKQGACTRDGECRTGLVPARGVHAVDVGGSDPVLANLTVTGNAGRGFISAGDCTALDGATLPDWSNVNFADETARANLSVVFPDDDGVICAWSETDTHVIVDLLGRVTSDTGLGWRLTDPTRVLDTRKCVGERCGVPVGAGEVIEVELGVDAPAAVVNVTATGAVEDGFATIGPCAALRAVTGLPDTSTVNVDRDATAANMAVVTTGGDGTCAWASIDMHLIVDVQAELVTERDLGLQVLPSPERVYDGRKGG